MIDELAKAFCCKNSCQKRIGGQQCFAPIYEKGVVDLLRRLREPTPEMIRAGASRLLVGEKDPSYNPLTARIFTAMIDAAIGGHDE